ncbi:MAG: hypothetical protein HZA05_03930 [Nitrospirae bacterium]|nr:hypothetical protein [Nitrospirota bacterium]
MSEIKRITVEDFCRMFNCQADELPEWFISKLDRINTNYREVNIDEFKEYVLQVLKRIAAPYITRSRDENLEAFEKGWRENLELLISGSVASDSLKPKYFRPSKFLRYNKELIISETIDIEYDLFTVARYLIFARYLSPYENIYEIGCGSCQNILMLSDMFPSKSLFGLDWTTASTEIAAELAKSLHRDIHGLTFDMLNPPDDFKIKEGSAIITIHALEQIGSGHKKLISFLRESKPTLVIHYEPILEFYDEDNLLDYLALIYSQKRNYLSGFYTELKILKEQGQIEILEARRPNLGGVIHEASLIIWRPI